MTLKKLHWLRDWCWHGWCYWWLVLEIYLNSSLSRFGQFCAIAAIRCSNWIFREILSAVPIASTRRFFCRDTYYIIIQLFFIELIAQGFLLWSSASRWWRAYLWHGCNKEHINSNMHVMTSISVTFVTSITNPIPVRTRPSSCCWWVSMNFLIAPSDTLSDLEMETLLEYCIDIYIELQ